MVVHFKIKNMKQIIKHIFALALVTAFVAGCEKTEVLPFYKNGNAPQLSTSTAVIAATPADSLNPVLNLSWTSPGYATDSNTIKYIVQIDTAGGNFTTAYTRTLSGSLSASLTAKDLNAILIAWGFKAGTAYNLQARVISSYANNNEQYTSNTVALKATPYKVPPKIPVPGELIIVGGATVGGWDNPAADADQAIAQRFALVDETTYAGIFYLTAGEQYLILPKSGNWDHKFGGTSNTGGDLLADGEVPGSNTPAPAADGWYKIVVDFQLGKYFVTPFTLDYGLPSKLVVVGGASDYGWTNDLANPQKFTRLNSVQFAITTNLKKDDAYLILPEPGNWDKKYGVEDKSVPAAKLGGSLKPGGQDIPSPSEAGSYKIEVNFADDTYKLTKI
jgi:hypothetical protein